MTVGWILDRLLDRPRLLGTIAWTLGVSSKIELGLIAVHAWRGGASHFFEGTNAELRSFLQVAESSLSTALAGTAESP